MSDKELKITEERVKAVAEKCGTAKEILKELFPDVFKVAPPEWEDISENVKIRSGKEKCWISIEFEWDIFELSGDSHSGWAIKECGPKYDSYYGGSDFKIEEGRIWRRKSA